jgi:hypothetical protein
MLNATGYFFCEDTAPLTAERNRQGDSAQLHQPARHLAATIY